jgi:hypothetical protein
MHSYQVDWLVQSRQEYEPSLLFLTKTLFPRLSEKTVYLIVGLLTVIFSFTLRLLLRHFGI